MAKHGCNIPDWLDEPLQGSSYGIPVPQRKTAAARMTRCGHKFREETPMEGSDSWAIE
jgi:hypothetical protein